MIRKWIQNKFLMWAARKIGPRLGKALIEELASLKIRADLSPSHADEIGVAILRGIVDPAVRPKGTSEALKGLAMTMAVRAHAHDGKLDDALVIVIRGVLNC